MEFHAVLTKFELLESVILPVCSIFFFRLQDLYLHQFFQHCQFMKSTAEGTPADLVKYLKVRLIFSAHIAQYHTHVVMVASIFL